MVISCCRTDPTNGSATHFAIKNYGAVSSGELRTTNITIGAYEKFRETINDTSITNIVSVQDADGNNFYEVDYLTQNIGALYRKQRYHHTVNS